MTSPTARQAKGPCCQLLESLPSLFDDAALSDVTFVVARKREIHAHRIILAMSSSKFRNMFTGKTDARYHERVIPLDDDPEAFSLLIRYLYGQ
jgi:hypothetical protein